MKTIQSITNLILKLIVICFLVKGFLLFISIKNINMSFFEKNKPQKYKEKNCVAINNQKKNIKKEKKVYGIDISHYRLKEAIKASQIDTISFVKTFVLG